jgi:hypothetical protein
LSTLSFSFSYWWNFCWSQFSSGEKNLLNIMTISYRRKYAGQAFRDLEWEKRVQEICQESAIGAQFGGKYLTRC